MVRVHSAPGAVLAVSLPRVFGFRLEVTDRMSRRNGVAVEVGGTAAAVLAGGCPAGPASPGGTLTGGAALGGAMGLVHTMGVGVSVRLDGVIVGRGPLGFWTGSAFS